MNEKDNPWGNANIRVAIQAQDGRVMGYHFHHPEDMSRDAARALVAEAVGLAQDPTADHQAAGSVEAERAVYKVRAADDDSGMYELVREYAGGDLLVADIFTTADAQFILDACKARAALDSRAQPVAAELPKLTECRHCGFYVALNQPPASAQQCANSRPAGGVVEIGVITNGDVEGDEIGEWDIIWNHKLIDSLEEFRVPNATYGVYLCPTADRQPAATLAASAALPAADEFPAGAIHNGAVYIQQLENIYDFQCEAGPLKNCVEWIELRRCFDAMVEYLSASAAQPGASTMQQILTALDHHDLSGNAVARIEMLVKHWEATRVASPVAAAVPDGWQAALDEVERATRKFPTWPTDPLHAVAVLGEEFGELTKATLQTVYEPHKVADGELRTEAVQTAAMALRFLASLDRYEFVASAQHKQGAAAPTNDKG